jgi:hypothetical protein
MYNDQSKKEQYFKRQQQALDKINKAMLQNVENHARVDIISSPLDNLTDFERMEIILQSRGGVPDEVIDDLIEDPNCQYSGHSTLFEPYLTSTEKEIVEALLYRRR